MFPSLPKFADKAFVLGFLLPALIGMGSLFYLLHDLALFEDAYKQAVKSATLALTIVALGMWLVAVILRICNHWLYRLLEGYSGPFKREWWRRAHQARMLRLLEGFGSLNTQLHDAWASPAVKQERLADLRHLYRTYPTSAELVLPTRFGNAIRAFETYANQVYGVDPISAWLRLQAVVPASHQVVLDDARAVVDFFVNLYFISMTVAMLSLAYGAVEIGHQFGHPQLSLTDPLLRCAEGLPAALLVAFAAYRGAIATAMDWGEHVKATFDLYLPNLARQLGYQLPGTARKRAQFWNDVSCMFLYRERISAAQWGAATASAEAGESAEGEKEKGEEKGTEEKVSEKEIDEKVAEGGEETREDAQQEP